MAISLNSLNSTVSSYGTRITNLEKKIGAGGGIIESKLANPGYVKFANGLIINFGYTGVSSGGTPRSVTFAKAFSTAPTFTVSMRSGGAGDAQYNGFIVSGVSTTSATFRNQARESSSMSWIAIGYLITNRVKNWLFNKISSIKGLI